MNTLQTGQIVQLELSEHLPGVFWFSSFLAEHFPGILLFMQAIFAQVLLRAARSDVLRAARSDVLRAARSDVLLVGVLQTLFAFMGSMAVSARKATKGKNNMSARIFIDDRN